MHSFVVVYLLYELGYVLLGFIDGAVVLQVDFLHLKRPEAAFGLGVLVGFAYTEAMMMRVRPPPPKPRSERTERPGRSVVDQPPAWTISANQRAEAFDGDLGMFLVHLLDHGMPVGDLMLLSDSF